MRTTMIPRSIALITGGLFLSLAMVQCKKEGVNASKVSRALLDTPDSTIYAQFYDSVAIAKRDATPDVNDAIITKGVFTIIKSNCVSASCHGGNVSPDLRSYNGVKSMVLAGNPEASRLYQLITTSDLTKAMPPITFGVDLSVSEKTIIYNWIKNGAKEYPALEDFRPSAISLIVNGCGSANCHNQATATGAWARKGLLGPLTTSDTSTFAYINPATGSTTLYAQLKEPKLSQVWKAYKDSARLFYSDTVANANFRLYKTLTTPISASSTRGPLNTYDDILFDIMYPKSVRSNSSVVYTDPVTLRTFYSRGDPLNATSSLISRIDSTILLANPRLGVFATTHQGDMAYGDGGLSKSEIALIKAWYFADPNIPSVWKYGLGGAGIFKYRKTGTIIR